MKTVIGTSAIIKKDDLYLCTKRGHGVRKGLWEFPGGHVEDGETPEEATIREIKEELNADIKVIEYVTTAEQDYEDFHLSLYSFICELTSEFELLEHLDAKWLTIDELDSLEWCEADIQIVDKLKSITKK